jgi:hypothetical protein
MWLKVFGDVFQLLDRVKEGESRGKSEYGIKFNKGYYELYFK